MKVAALVVFRDEADAIPAWLKHMDQFADFFLFRDNASSDGGGAIVQEHPKTVYYQETKTQFKTSLWNALIQQAQQFLSKDDWFLICAFDHFPFFNIKSEISKALSANSEVNCLSIHYPTFFFTKEMYRKYKAEKQYKNKIDSFSIENYDRFRITGGDFPLLIKNTGGVKYTRSKQEPPWIVGKKVYRKKHLFIGHYRFRSPLQMKNRMEARQVINPKRSKFLSFAHYPTWNWADYLISEKQLFKVGPERTITNSQLGKRTLANIVAREKNF